MVEDRMDEPKTSENEKLKQKVIEQLQTVFDPEIPVNVYELGLIYEDDRTPHRDDCEPDATIDPPPGYEVPPDPTIDLAGC